MYPHDGRVDHLDGGIMSGSKRVHEPAPYASSPPADEAVIAGSIWAITFRQITPWRARSQHPKDAVEDTSIIHSGHASRLVRQYRSDGRPFVLGEFVTHRSRLRSWDHGLAVATHTRRLPMCWSVPIR